VISTIPYSLIVGFAGTALQLIMARLAGMALVAAPVVASMLFTGLVLKIWARISLNRSFGVVAANRGVKTGGRYRIAGYPMYLGYIIQVGFPFGNYNLANETIYLLCWGFQIASILEEEHVLLLDPAYQEMAQHARYWLAPGII
jgi:protein-S-isoprenylcysteine O-methyltransferase Ste14